MVSASGGPTVEMSSRLDNVGRIPFSNIWDTEGEILVRPNSTSMVMIGNVAAWLRLTYVRIDQARRTAPKMVRGSKNIPWIMSIADGPGSGTCCNRRLAAIAAVAAEAQGRRTRIHEAADHDLLRAFANTRTAVLAKK